MKTLVVLFALVSVALAAPTLQEEGLKDTNHAKDWNIQAHPMLEHIKREKKSPSEQSANTVLLTGIPSADVHTDTGASTHTARSFSLKKPVIVKKKYGYRLYRDSEEEKANADSHESCGRQVKVKLCDEDGKFREMLRSTGHETSNIHSSEDDMKNSIMMAKEAVENLQRDLKKMNHKSDVLKMSHNSDTDTDLHEDIEVARQALEHIHKNFGNLETMTLHATASGSSEATHDLHVTVAKSEEEKMAQWKEAMDTIQKNVEIARNIEDSFKNTDDETQLHLDQPESTTKNEHKSAEDFTSHDALADEHMEGIETTHLKTETMGKDNSKEQFLDKAVDKASSEHLAREDQHSEDDMKPSASEAIEMKTVDIENHHTLSSENHKHHQHEHSTESKSDEHITDVNNQAKQDIEKTQEHIQLTKNSDAELTMVTTEPGAPKHLQTLLKEVDEQSKTEDKDALFKSSENIEDNPMAFSMESINTLNSDALSDQHQRMIESSDKTEHNLSNEKVLDAKSAEHVDDKKQMIHEEVHDKTKFHKEIEKSAEELKPELDSELFGTKPKDTSHGLFKETEERYMQDHVTPVQINVQNFDDFVEENGDFMKAAHPSNLAAMDSLRVQQKHHNIDYNESEEVTSKLSNMKSADDHIHHPLTILKSDDEHLHHHQAMMKNTEDLHHLESEPVHTHWGHDNRHLASMKYAEDFRKEIHGMDHMDSHLPEHHFGRNKMGYGHDFEISEHGHHNSHFPSKFHYNMVPHSKVHDRHNMHGGPLSSNFHPSMRDAMEGLESEHMYRWQPSHESSRSAFGPSIAAAGITGGAVGVFPNANAGGCGIPLLLSCSPSVVSGSLAKAHGASYAAPSYRSEDDFSFHNKRDIKKTTEIRNSNILRTPAIVKQKTPKLLENKM